MSLPEFLEGLDFNNIGKSILFSDLEDNDEDDISLPSSKQVSPNLRPTATPITIIQSATTQDVDSSKDGCAPRVTSSYLNNNDDTSGSEGKEQV